MLACTQYCFFTWSCSGATISTARNVRGVRGRDWAGGNDQRTYTPCKKWQGHCCEQDFVIHLNISPRKHITLRLFSHSRSSQTDSPSGLKLSTYLSISSLRGSPLHAPSCHSVTLSACHYITLMHPPTTLVMQRQTCMHAQREALPVVVSERFVGRKWQKAILKTFSHIFCTNELKRIQSLYFIRLNFRPVLRAAARRCFDRTDAPTFCCLPMLLTSSGTSRSLTNLPDIFIRGPVYSAGERAAYRPADIRRGNYARRWDVRRSNAANGSIKTL